MQDKPMVAITKSGVVVTPEAFDLWAAHTRHFIHASRSQLDEYIAVGNPTCDDSLIGQTQHELSVAVMLLRQLEQAQGHVAHVYDRNFVSLAEVFRKTRLDLGHERIEDNYTLHTNVLNLMAMLKRENPRFDREKFINYINEDPSIIPTQARRVSA